MLTTTATVAWLGVHVMLWMITQFMLSIAGVSDEVCPNGRFLCGTPIEDLIEKWRELPSLGLIGVLTLIPNIISSLWSILSVNYDIIQGDGIGGYAGLLLRCVSAASSIQMLWGGAQVLIQALRG